MHYDNRIKLHFWLHIAFIVIAIGMAVLVILTSKASGNEAVASHSDFYDTAVASWESPMYKTIEMVATITAYSSSPDETDSNPFETASGSRTRPGIIACPTNIPFGSVVEISWGQYVCEDRMHERNEGKFDIWMETKEEARQFGVRIVPIKINIFY